MNISLHFSIETDISKILSTISKPARIQILLVIAEQDACVCHFESVLGLRQASISQHLMVLRKAGLVDAHRDGRNIFYHLSHPEILDIIKQTACLISADPLDYRKFTMRPIPNCTCPQCNPGLDPELTCKTKQSSPIHE